MPFSEAVGSPESEQAGALTFAVDEYVSISPYRKGGSSLVKRVRGEFGPHAFELEQSDYYPEGVGYDRSVPSSSPGSGRSLIETVKPVTDEYLSKVWGSIDGKKLSSDAGREVFGSLMSLDSELTRRREEFERALAMYEATEKERICRQLSQLIEKA